MEIRRAGKDDLDEIMEIYAYARRFMAEHGNPGQWGEEYPLRSHIEEDIEKGQGWHFISTKRHDSNPAVIYFTKD